MATMTTFNFKTIRGLNEGKLKISVDDKNKLIDVRKYYEKDGELLPMKKGITLSMEEWEEVIAVLQECISENNKKSG